ncbi:MAG: tetratricopeptide repeat protein [Hyphomicrobiaceae bacterium]|nr:tetratricopeptide repeat protein [Hyphomicrobiaceae bacterium]
MSADNDSGQKGMLESAANKNALGRLIDLYLGDTAFRGMTDFVAIGALALMFLSPPHKVTWPWSGGSQVGGGSGQALKQPDVGSGVGGPSPVAGLPLPIPFPARVSNPSINSSLIEIDSRAFSSSKPDDQRRLVAALIAFATSAGSSKITDLLRNADGNDRNVAMMRGLGLMLGNTPSDNLAAMQQLRFAMDKGQPQARAYVGWMLRSGKPGIQRDEAESNRLLEESAAAGDPQSMRLVASGLLSGELGRVDAVRAYGLARKAADAGDRVGMFLTARLAADGIGINNPNGKDAEAYLRKAARAGLTEAQITLGNWLNNIYVKGLSNDLKEADDWFKRAYENGHLIDALVNRAYLRSDVAKDGHFRDLAMARNLLEGCSAFQHGWCQNNLAVLLSNPQAGPMDNVRARAHFAISAELKNRNGEAGARTLEARLTMQERQEAAAYLGELKKQMRMGPPPILVQYAELTGVNPPPPAARAPPRSVPQPVKSAEPQKSTAADGPSQPQSKAPAAGGTKGPDLTRSSPDFVTCTTGTQDHSQRASACTRAIETGGIDKVTLGRALASRGFARWQLGDNSAAQKDLDEAIRLAPNVEPNFLVFRGVVRSNLGTHDEGLADIDAALRAKDANGYGHAWRGEILRRMKRFDDAMAAADKATSISKSEVQAYIVRTDIHIDNNRWLEAAQQTVAGLSVAPNNGELLRRSGDAYFELKQWQQAIAAYDQVIRSNPRNAYVVNRRGRAHLSLGATGYDAALADFTEAIRIDGKAAVYYANRAIITAARGQTDLALSDLDKAIDLDRRNTSFLLRRAALHRDAKRFSSAIADLDQALEIEPGTAAHHVERGRLRYLELVELQDFCAEARRQAALPQNQGLHGVGGGLRCSAPPDYESALQDLNAAVRMAPATQTVTIGNAHYWAGKILLQAGQHTQALKAFENSYQVHPGSGNAMVDAGVIWQNQLRDERRALELYSEAIRVNPRNAFAYWNRGNVLSRQRATVERGIADLRQALEIEEIPGARRRLDEVLRSR